MDGASKFKVIFSILIVVFSVFVAYNSIKIVCEMQQKQEKELELIYQY